jgi:hypothetical protein
MIIFYAFIFLVPYTALQVKPFQRGEMCIAKSIKIPIVNVYLAQESITMNRFRQPRYSM